MGDLTPRPLQTAGSRRVPLIDGLRIFVILDYPSPLNPAVDNMVQSTRDVDTGLSRHCRFATQLGMPGKL